jgi:hypothetical protein
MSKRKRVSKPESDDSSDDAAVKDDMVHVTPELLAGSPDIFAGKKTSSVGEPAGAAEQATVPAVESQPPAPTEASTTLAPEPPAETETLGEASAEPPEEALGEPAAQTSPTPETGEAPSAPPPFVDAVAQAPRKRGRGASALGIVFVVVGVFALAVVLSGVDLTENGWPLFVIIPGLTLLVVGFVSAGTAATVPGGILTMLGVVLAYTSATGDWPLWAYGWALVVPGGIGLAIYLQGMRDHDAHGLHTGRTLMFIGLMIFLIGFVLFESILGISGRDYFGQIGKAALPVLLILVGALLFVRSVQGNRRGGS